MPDASDLRVDTLLRDLAPQVLGAVVRRFRDFAAAEDATQEALIAAALQWPREGVPDNPRGWLIQVAVRRITDAWRSDQARRRREDESARAAEAIVPAPDDPSTALGEGDDDTLLLLLLCCHPSLSSSSAIALTLRAVGGLTTGEIARAFFVPEATMGQRISRAKQSIKASGARFEAPDARERADRLVTVMHVLYLIFNEGYTSSAGPALRRDDLSSEAIRLARLLHRAAPDEAEAAGLLALMLLTDARRLARSGPDGELIPLTEQDRSQWDQDAIREGVALLTSTLERGTVGSYQLQAAIAAVHDEAPSADATDWPQILALYGLLARMSDNPMVVLNQAIAVAMVSGPLEGLARLSALDADDRIARHHRLEATRAHLLEMAGDIASAIEHYLRAADRTASVPERNYLLGRAARLGHIRAT
jgi:RNA polymerase sigma factor (sigma-70 family)